MFKVVYHEVASQNGSHRLPVILVDVKNSQSVTTMFLANTGARYEKENEEGLAHFFEHMVFKGTKKFPSPKILAETLDSVGADFNAFTSKEYTGYYVRSATSNFTLALDVLSDMLFQAKLRQSDIDREKGVIIEELNMYQDDPPAHIADVFEEMVFTKRSLAHSVIGRKETIQSFQSADFENFLRQFYAPENLLLVIAGGIQALCRDESEILSQVETMLDKLQDERIQVKNAAPKLAGANPTLIAQKSFSKQKFKLINKATAQAHFVMAWPAINASHRDRYALQVLSTIVGGNMSSRLFNKVREEHGLAYYVHSDLEFYHDTGFFGCSAGVDASRAEEAIKLSKAVFTDLLDKKAKISAQELARVKDYLRGKTLLSLESSNQLAQFFGLRKLLREETVTVEEVLKKFDVVTIEDLDRIAQAIIREDELRLAIIGDFKNEEKLRLAMS